MSERRRVRMWLPDRSGQRGLVDAVGNLPSFDIELADADTTLLAVRRVVMPAIGLNSHVVDCYIEQGRTGPGHPVPVLLGLPAPPADWVAPPDHRWSAWSDCPGVETGLQPVLDEWWAIARGARPPHPLRPAWSAPGWFEQAAEWIATELRAAGWPPPDSIEQFRHWGISSVMRVETAAGRCWFKALFPPFRSEPSVTALLHEELPGAVAGVLAHDPDAGWMLLTDIVAVGAAGSDPSRHRDAVARLVAIQRHFHGDWDRLVRAGCRRRPLSRLAQEFAEALTRPCLDGWISLASGRAEQLVEWVTQAAERVASTGAPDALVHGDFHPGNVIESGDGPVIFDWSDAAVSHPLIDIAVWASWLTDAPDEIDALWDSFLAAWAGADWVAATRLLRPELEAVMGAFHFVSYVTILAGVEPSRQVEHAEGLGDFLGLVERSLPV